MNNFKIKSNKNIALVAHDNKKKELFKKQHELNNTYKNENNALEKLYKVQSHLYLEMDRQYIWYTSQE